MPNTPNLNLRPLVGSDLARELPILLTPELTKIDTAWGRVVQAVLHGSSDNLPRPSGLLVVWVGSVYPLNSTSTDIWVDPTPALATSASLPQMLFTAASLTPTFGTYNGVMILANSGTAQTVTLPNSWEAGGNFTYVVLGTGQTTFVAASGATLVNFAGAQYKSAGQHALVTAFVRSNTTGTNAAWQLGGDTAA
jgi:hypothetical protein